MTNAILTDDMTVEQKVIVLAKDAARCFVDEFNEPFGSDAGDWDVAAWETDLAEIRDDLDGLTDADINALWPIYQEHLIAESQRLVSQSLANQQEESHGRDGQ